MSSMFLHRAFRKAGPPIHLIWFVTGKCNLRCAHCFFHENLNAGKNELTLEEFDMATDAMDPVLALCLTGGEPFLRPDLTGIIDLFCRKGLTRFLTLYTNGFLPDRVAEVMERAAVDHPKVNFSVGVSVDGFQPTHDRLRGVDGSFSRAMQTLEHLKKLSAQLPNLGFGAQSTLHAENYEELAELRREIKDRFGIKQGFTMIRGDAREQALKSMSPRAYVDIVQQNREDMTDTPPTSPVAALIQARERLGHEMALETFLSGNREYDCYAGSLMGVVSETGDVYPCEMLDNSCMGSLREMGMDLNAVWHSDRAQSMRKRIAARKCHCTYECQFTCNTLYNPRHWPTFLTAVLKSLPAWVAGR